MLHILHSIHIKYPPTRREAPLRTGLCRNVMGPYPETPFDDDDDE